MAFTMYDSINVDQIPVDAQAVAGYIGGKWPTYADGSLAKRCPKARKLSIAVASRYDAECLDVEPGDATNDVAGRWVKRMQARGIKHPVVYTSVSNVPALLGALAKDGIKRLDIRLWTAHYTGRPHLCGPQCGFGMSTTADATQYTNHALGRTLDASLCRDGFLPPVSRLSAEDKKQARWRHRLPGARRDSAKADKAAAARRERVKRLLHLIGRKKK
jgi:hypothetical protein